MHSSLNEILVPTKDSGMVIFTDPVFPLPRCDPPTSRSLQVVTPVAAQLTRTDSPRVACVAPTTKTSDGGTCASPPPVGGSTRIGGCPVPVPVGGCPVVGAVG